MVIGLEYKMIKDYLGTHMVHIKSI